MAGIHHVTAISGNPSANLEFYTRTLGLRFVKKTVNFDDPGSYHFYYGDAAGRPGTILTFFPWEAASPGRLGIGEAQETVFSVPEGSIGYWTQRLIGKGVAHDPPAKRFSETILAFKDRDGTARPCRRQGGRGGAHLERRGGAAGTRDSRLPQRDLAAGRGRADRRHFDRRFRLCS